MYVTNPNECYRARRRQRPADLAVQAAAHDRHHGGQRATAASRSPAIGVFMETDNAHLIALNRFTGELLWDTRARRLAEELLGVVGAAAGRQSGHRRRHRRRARRERLRRRARSGDGQGSVALLDRAEAGRAGIGDLGGQGHRARRRADVVHRQLRSGARHRLLAGRQSQPGSTTATSARATTSTRTACWRSIARPAR